VQFYGEVRVEPPSEAFKTASSSKFFIGKSRKETLRIIYAAVVDHAVRGDTGVVEEHAASNGHRRNFPLC